MYQDYHDREWGVPVMEDERMFEFLLLETFQAGLSWFTILKKRAHFREAFAGFNLRKVAQFTEKDEERLLGDSGIIRNAQKIRAAIHNAQAFSEIQTEWGSFCRYIWSFVDHTPLQNNPRTAGDIPATTSISDALSKDLKKRGFKFVGSTTLYAHMQACGMVNDHTTDCFRHAPVKKLASTVKFR